MVTWSCTQVRIYLRKYTYTAVFAEAPWMRMRESCVGSMVVKLNVHQKVTLRVLVLKFHSRGRERL